MTSQDRPIAKALQERAGAVIPGGMYGRQSARLSPDDYPQFFARARGARLWDVDGHELLDFMCAYGPNLLGYGDEKVDAAFLRQLDLGDTMTGPTALMVELAETMTAMISHAYWALFCKNAGEPPISTLLYTLPITRRQPINYTVY